MKVRNSTFTLTPEQAYGGYVEERVLDLDKQIFTIDGHFDSERIHKDAIVPLQNEDGNRFMGHVLDISEDKVKVDLNHPFGR
jgi:FKBP-type peptidyl-prolyl cis-trans isomerase SlyD